MVLFCFRLSFYPLCILQVGYDLLLFDFLGTVPLMQPTTIYKGEGSVKCYHKSVVFPS